jgi:uncharacterized protein
LKVYIDNSTVNFVETKPFDLRGYSLIEGFPGMGLVGTISAKYLTEKLEFKEIGYIESNMFMPIIRVHEGLPVHPSRIYINEKYKLVVMLSEQVVPQFFVDKLARAVVQWIESKKISRIISLAGIKAASEEQQEKNTVYGIASDDASKEILRQHNVEIIKEGITSGINALILLELRDKNIDAFSLLGNVDIAADYKASALLIQKLSEIIGFEIDTKPLLKEAKETEQAILEHLEQLKKTGEDVQKLEDSQTPSMYS